jgi:hypothetical protein
MMARFVRAETGVWNITGANPHGTLSQRAGERAVPEVGGPFGFAPDYLGCPRCHAVSYVKCGVCQQLSCWPGTGLSTCGWCGTQGYPRGEITSLQRAD